MNTIITGTARLAADPELRFIPSGKAICEVRLAFSNSTRDAKTKEYRYSPPIWVTATLWEGMAENAAEVLRRGDEVIVSGQLEKETFEKRDGTQGEKLVIKFAEVAPSIRRGAVKTREQADPHRQQARSDNRQTVGAGARSAPPAAGAPAFPDEPPF